MSKVKNKNELFICECNSVEHQLIFNYIEDDPEVYMMIHLHKLSLLSRIIYAIKYIFGRQSRFGAFDEFIFNPDDTDKLQSIVDHLRAAKEFYDKSGANS